MNDSWKYETIAGDSFLCIATAWFDPITGVTLHCQLKQNYNICGETLEDYFRFTFGNVSSFHNYFNLIESQDKEDHDLQQQLGNEIKTGSFEINSQGFIIITCSVPIDLDNRKRFYGLSFFIKKSDVIPCSEIYDLLRHECAIATVQVSEFIQEGKDFLTNVTSIVKNTAKAMTHIMHAHISSLPPLSIINPNEINFYSAVLSSHLQTQMTTIIEAENQQQASQVFNFLAHFLLPYQLSLSSPNIHRDPIRGLYLQCVEKKQTLPYELLFTFNRPWTWVRVKDKMVFQSPSITTQSSIAKEYIQSIKMDVTCTEADKQVKMNKFKKIYKTEVTTHPQEKWSSSFLTKYIKQNPSIQPFLCEMFIRNQLEKGMLLIELIDHYLNSLDRYFLRKSEVAEITQSLGITDKDELKAITAVAQFFDQRTFRRMQRAKEVLNKLVSTV